MEWDLPSAAASWTGLCPRAGGCWWHPRHRARLPEKCARGHPQSWRCSAAPTSKLPAGPKGQHSHWHQQNLLEETKHSWKHGRLEINVTFLAALAVETWQNWYQSLKVWSLPRWSPYTVTPFQFLVFHRAALGVLLCPSDRKITLELLSPIRAHHSRRQIQVQISIDLALRFFFYISSLTLKWVTSKTNKQKNLCVCQVLKLEGVYKNYCFPRVHLILCFLPTYLLHLPCLTNHKLQHLEFLYSLTDIILKFIIFLSTVFEIVPCLSDRNLIYIYIHIYI